MKISIRWALILGCLVLIWGTQTIITSSTYWSSQRVLVGHAHDIMQNITDLTMEQSKNHLALAQGAARLTKRLIASEVVSSSQERLETLEKYFLDQLAIYPHFAGIYVGMPNGDFFYVSRSSRHDPNGFRTKIIRHAKGQRETRLLWRNQHHQLIESTSDPQDSYDPRQRPWYLKAQQTKTMAWTDPYIFFTSQKPGITVAGPIFSAPDQIGAVVGVDIEIDQLSTFISKLRIGKNGSAFMLNNNGDVVAFPDLEKIRFSENPQQSNIRLVKIDEIDDDLAKAAYHAQQWDHATEGRLLLQAPKFARFEYNGQAYLSMFTPFENSKWPWIIGVYLPENDYLGSIKANRRFNILLTLGLSVVATLIGLWYARGIIRPLAALAKEALAINMHDATRNPKIQSNYKELQVTADAFTRMKEDLRVGEEKYRRIFENIQDIYYEADRNGRLIEISPSIERISSYSREDLIGHPIEKIYRNSRDRKRFLVEIASQGKVTDYEIALTTKSGEIEYCSINAVLKRDAQGAPYKIIGSARIITDRKKTDLALKQHQNQLEELVRHRTKDLEATLGQLSDQMAALKAKEAELRKSEEKYRSIIENMENGYFEVDIKGKLTFFNQPLVEIMGYDRTELMGLSFYQYMDSDTAQAIGKRFSAIWRTGQPYRLARYEVIRKDGTRRALDATASLITDSNGQPVGFRGVVFDITERLTAEKEKERLERRLQQIQRLEGIGTLAGGVAHDFNNLLMGIQGNVSLMLLEMDIHHPHYDRLKSIESCITGGANLTRQLLGFARGGKYMVKPLDFNQVVQNTLKMFGRTRKEIQIHEKLEQKLWAVMADQSQFEQVLLNLYINAWQAMPDGGHLYVETKNTQLDDALHMSYGIKAGRYVCISIADTGTGMDEATQHKLFEPFFTTKEIGRGTGLGLASAFGIIKNHDGAIDFKTQLGHGTTFYIYLPACDKAVDLLVAKDSALSKGSETILVVDDEAMILNVSKSMLEKMGYRVLAAQGGRAAIEIFEAAREPIDMVILDMIMPDLGGGAVFDRLKSIQPDVKVLLCTGYSLSGQAEEILARGCNGVIQKPFNIEKLGAKIREILEAS
jgi:two-component system, cell cycle sensor histidine kinase and response regulator CckA